MNRIRYKMFRPSLARGFFFVRRQDGSIDLGNIILGLFILGALYGSYVFAPLVWKKQELKYLLKEVSFQLKSMSEDDAKTKIIESAKRELGVALDPKDVKIVISEDHILLKATWKPQVRLIDGKIHVFPMDVEQNTTIFR